MSPLSKNPLSRVTFRLEFEGEGQESLDALSFIDTEHRSRAFLMLKSVWKVR